MVQFFIENLNIKDKHSNCGLNKDKMPIAMTLLLITFIKNISRITNKNVFQLSNHNMICFQIIKLER